MSCSQKKLKTSGMVPPDPVRISAQRLLAPSVTSAMSVADDKGDNEIVLRAVPRSPGICFMADETPYKTQLGDCLVKAVRPVVTSNGAPYLQIRSLGSHTTSESNEWGGGIHNRYRPVGISSIVGDSVLCIHVGCFRAK